MTDEFVWVAGWMDGWLVDLLNERPLVNLEGLFATQVLLDSRREGPGENLIADADDATLLCEAILDGLQVM